jgi:hypothetical protein
MNDSAGVSQSGTDRPAAASNDALRPTRTQFFVVLASYFALHLVTRTLVSEVAGIDEGNQLVAGQKWSWGYGPQPPLYTWLMMLFVRGFGHSEFSLTLLRELMLLGIYVLTYFNARTLTRSHVCGIAAAIALQFSPTIVWESQRELTHSILASLLTLATLLAFLRAGPRGWRAHVALGVFGGLSILAKYNGVIFYAGLLIAAATLPNIRSRIFDRRMAAAAGISVLLVLPHLCWDLTHWDLASASLYKFGADTDLPWGPGVLKGLMAWCNTFIQHVVAVPLVMAIIFAAPLFRGNALRFHSDEERALWRTFLVIFTVVVISVLCFEITSFKERWLQPLFVSVPILLVAVLRDNLNGARLKAMLWLGAVIGVIVEAVAPGRVLLTEQLHKREILNAPFRRLAPDLARWVRESDFVVSPDDWLAGNLRLWFPDKLVVSPELMSFYAPSGRRCLMVWEVNRQTDPPPAVLRFATSFTGAPFHGTPAYVEECWKYHQRKELRFGVIELEKAPPALVADHS